MSADIAIPKPTLMPSLKFAKGVIEERLTRRWSRLCGMLPAFDLSLAANGAWVVGSTVWRPVVLGSGMPHDGDLDLVFTEPEQRDAVLERIHEFRRTLDGESWQVGSSPYNPREAIRVTRGEQSLIDLWCVPTGVTVEECVLSFSEPHQRVAYDCATAHLFRGVHRCNPPGVEGKQPWESTALLDKLRK